MSGFDNGGTLCFYHLDVSDTTNRSYFIQDSVQNPTFTGYVTLSFGVSNGSIKYTYGGECWIGELTGPNQSTIILVNVNSIIPTPTTTETFTQTVTETPGPRLKKFYLEWTSDSGQWNSFFPTAPRFVEAGTVISVENHLYIEGMMLKSYYSPFQPKDTYYPEFTSVEDMVTKLSGLTVEEDAGGLYVRYLVPDSTFILEWTGDSGQWNSFFPTAPRFVEGGTVISVEKHLYIEGMMLKSYYSPFQPKDTYYPEFTSVEDMVTMLEGQTVNLNGGVYSITIS